MIPAKYFRISGIEWATLGCITGILTALRLFPKSSAERVIFLIRQLALFPCLADPPRGLFGRKQPADTDLTESDLVGEIVREQELWGIGFFGANGLGIAWIPAHL
jgi:hypothetical protein